MPHHGATRNPRRARHRRRRNRFHPPPAPPVIVGHFLPFDDAWRPRYNDTTKLRCGGYAVAEMIAIHRGEFIDPHPIYNRALELQPPGPATSPWANLEASREQGLLTSYKWFKDLDTARNSLFAGYAFVVLANAHIFCIRGFSDENQALYSPDDAGSPVDWAIPYAMFQSFMEPSWAICGAGVY